MGTLEASRFATGRKNALSWEINGSKGSIAFDLERLNECAAVCDAILRSAESGAREEVSYRD